eukprot:2491386-Rhodomonas_salina.1
MSGADTASGRAWARRCFLALTLRFSSCTTASLTGQLCRLPRAWGALSGAKMVYGGVRFIYKLQGVLFGSLLHKIFTVAGDEAASVCVGSGLIFGADADIYVRSTEFNPERDRHPRHPSSPVSDCARAVPCLLLTSSICWPEQRRSSRSLVLSSQRSPSSPSLPLSSQFFSSFSPIKPYTHPPLTDSLSHTFALLSLSPFCLSICFRFRSSRPPSTSHTESARNRAHISSQRSSLPALYPVSAFPRATQCPVLAALRDAQY